MSWATLHRNARLGVLPPASEPLGLGLEGFGPGQAPGEREEPRVGDHPVRRAEASAPDRPAPFQQLHRFQQAVASFLATQPEGGSDESATVREAVRVEWHGEPPEHVRALLSDHGVED